jgi:hypothetical protein
MASVRTQILFSILLEAFMPRVFLALLSMMLVCGQLSQAQEEVW